MTPSDDDGRGTMNEPAAADGAPGEKPAPARLEADQARDDLIVVGLGASAGGQEALERFLDNLPPDSGLAFVVVQHLSPTHESLLVKILARHTTMPVFQVQDGMPPLANHVYVIPPNRNLAILGAGFALMDSTPSSGVRLPIDHFFRSLAQDRKERAVCIILSGTGTDGSLGLRAIREGGGLVLAQKPSSCTYSGMPQSAIDTGLVDFVLTPEEMPRTLLAHIQHPYIQATKSNRSASPGDTDWLSGIFALLRERSGHDFSQYKRKTINRRIERRVALHQLESVADYFRFLQSDSNELQTLFKAMGRYEARTASR